MPVQLVRERESTERKGGGGRAGEEGGILFQSVWQHVRTFPASCASVSTEHKHAPTHASRCA